MRIKHEVFWVVSLFASLGVAFLDEGPIFNVCYFAAWVMAVAYLFAYYIALCLSTNKWAFKRHVIDVGPVSNSAAYIFSMGSHVFSVLLFASAGKYVLAVCLTVSLIFFSVYRAVYIKCREDMGIKVYSET